MKYRGYYITETFSQQDIDNMIRENGIRRFRYLAEKFAREPNMECSALMDQQATFLVKECGLSWEDIEAIELQAIA